MIIANYAELKRDLEASVETLNVLLRVMAERSKPDNDQMPVVVAPTKFMHRRAPTRREVEIKQLQRDPIRGACGLAIRVLGEHLFKVHRGTMAMREVAERAAELAPQDWGRRIAIIDHAWDGIGTDADRWVA